MKRKLKLSKIWNTLPEETREALLKTEGFSVDDPTFVLKRIPVIVQIVESDPDDEAKGYPGVKTGERAVLRYVSTRDVDRDYEVLDPSGAVLDQFKLAPQVLWAHDYSAPPIGKADWVRADDYGLKSKTTYAQTDRAEEVWQLIKGGFLATASVGFIPLKRVWKGDAEWAGLIAKYNAKWETDLEKSGAQVITTKWILLEYSDVPVPANPNALVTAIAKGETALSDEMQDALGLEEFDGEEETTEPADAEPEPVTPDPEPKLDIPIVRRIDPAVLMAEKPVETLPDPADPIIVRRITPDSMQRLPEANPVVVRCIDTAPTKEQLAMQVATETLNALRGRA